MEYLISLGHFAFWVTAIDKTVKRTVCNLCHLRSLDQNKNKMYFDDVLKSMGSWEFVVKQPPMKIFDVTHKGLQYSG